MLLTLSVCYCWEQLLLDIPVNLLVLFSPSGRPFPILFSDYSGLGFLMVLAAHSPQCFNLKFWLFSYVGSQDTDPTIHNFSRQHRAHIYAHGSRLFIIRTGVYVKGSTFSSTLYIHYNNRNDSHAQLSQKLSSSFSTGIHSNIISEIYFCKISWSSKWQLLQETVKYEALSQNPILVPNDTQPTVCTVKSPFVIVDNNRVLLCRWFMLSTRTHDKNMTSRSGWH